MGLRQRRKNSDLSTASVWLVAASISLLSGIIGIAGDPAREVLKYDRLAIDSGEWWRLASGHFAHLGGSHLLLNIAGLVLVWVLVGARLSAISWIAVTLFGIVCIDLGFWFIDTNLLWYVGLSGLLHTLLVAGAVAGLSSAGGESLIILAVVFGKIVYEQLAGPLPGSELTSGGSVVVNAHLYGSIAGLLAGIPCWRGVKR